MLTPKRHPLVRADMAEAYAWYEEERPGLGVEYLTELRATYRRMCDWPLLYAVRFAGVRRVNLRRFPYGIFYVVRPDEIWVLGVLHGARDSEAELARRRKSFF
ncbi:MAG: type II toxin-antitoxin system RelE/ParE family toxin [Limisphaerales bacterium]